MSQEPNPSPTPADTSPIWWRNGVVYQVYVRSFADANGDGTGDINGIRSRLGYLRDLGVDAIWMNPWYTSPLHDGGYDVADYRNIEERFGTLADAEALIREAHEHDIRVVTDLVPNHTSSEHVWFQEAIADPPGSVARGRYHFLDGTGPNGSEPPNDWRSVFGGSAWTQLTEGPHPGQWYLHLFDHTQPDLNWSVPEVQEEFCSILRFWLDRGVDGFRVDVAHGLAKDMDYPDIDRPTGDLLEADRRANHPFWDRDELHPIIRQWRAVLDEYEGERMMVAEAWVLPERIPLYLRPDEYHQSFDFNFLETDWVADDLHEAIDKALAAVAEVGSSVTWVLSNHDVVRHATRYGLPHGTNWRRWLLDGPHDALEPELGLRRARAAALLMLALPGSVYLYQGEELGLPEVWDLPTDVLDDPVWAQSNFAQKGRDGCRVPMPWTSDGSSFGFGDNGSWLPQPAAFAGLSAGAQQDVAGSTLELYRDALHRRREHWLGGGDLVWIDDEVVPEGVLAFHRGDEGADSRLECWVNVSSEPLTLADLGEFSVVLSSESLQETLPPNTAVWLRR